MALGGVSRYTPRRHAARPGSPCPPRPDGSAAHAERAWHGAAAGKTMPEIMARMSRRRGNLMEGRYRERSRPTSRAGARPERGRDAPGAIVAWEATPDAALETFDKGSRSTEYRQAPYRGQVLRVGRLRGRHQAWSASSRSRLPARTASASPCSSKKPAASPSPLAILSNRVPSRNGEVFGKPRRVERTLRGPLTASRCPLSAPPR